MEVKFDATKYVEKLAVELVEAQEKIDELFETLYEKEKVCELTMREKNLMRRLSALEADLEICHTGAYKAKVLMERIDEEEDFDEYDD